MSQTSNVERAPSLGKNDTPALKDSATGELARAGREIS